MASRFPRLLQTPNSSTPMHNRSTLSAHLVHRAQHSHIKAGKAGHITSTTDQEEKLSYLGRGQIGSLYVNMCCTWFEGEALRTPVEEMNRAVR
jgi:hypothetical protein